MRANSAWLDADTAPMVQQLLDLAKTQDAELATTGRLQAATAAAYRMAFRTLMELKPVEQRRRDVLEAEVDSLMSPSAWLGEDDSDQ